MYIIYPPYQPSPLHPWIRAIVNHGVVRLGGRVAGGYDDEFAGSELKFYRYTVKKSREDSQSVCISKN